MLRSVSDVDFAGTDEYLALAEVCGEHQFIGSEKGASSTVQPDHHSQTGIRISIITPLRDRNETAADAINSVSTQTFENVEHIVIDGRPNGPNAGFASQHSHPNLHIMSEGAAGTYEAMNEGIRLATGDVIGILRPGDSFAHQGVLDAIARAFRDRSIAGVYGDLDFVDALSGSRVVRRWRAGNMTAAKLRRGWMPPHPTLFVRRGVFERFGAYDTSFEVAADYDAMLRWFGHQPAVATYIPDVLVRVRLHGESTLSLSQFLRKSFEDYRALRRNEVGGAGSLIGKSLPQITELFFGASD